MRDLFLFLYRFRAFFLFIFLELLSAWMIVQNNAYQSAAFFNSANWLAAGTMNLSSNIYDYFRLSEVNQELANENARLKELLELKEDSVVLAGESFMLDTLLKQDSLQESDTLAQQQYAYTAAKVINNSTNRFNNYLTISKGKDAHIEEGMGVVGPRGVVGKVKAVSEHYATITSLLHSNFLISSVITSSNTFCSTQWGGQDPRIANLLYVPRHIAVNIGDTVVTSGYNAIFPADIPIGTVRAVDIEENATFYDIEIELSTDFSKLSYVYIIENELKSDKDSLEQSSFID
jgi:rod shape-determining protein MreC